MPTSASRMPEPRAAGAQFFLPLSATGSARPQNPSHSAFTTRPARPGWPTVITRLSVFLAFGVAAGFAACLVPNVDGWLWCIGVFLPLGPLMAMLFGVWRGWPEIHPGWLDGSTAVILLALSLPWAAAGCWLGIEIANTFDAGVNTAISVGLSVAAVFTVLLAYVALGIVTHDWSVRIAAELAAAAAATLLLMQLFVNRGQYALFPIGMGLMSVVIGWNLLRPGFIGSQLRTSVGSLWP